MPRFGEQRLVRSDVGAVQRVLFRLVGVADPAHYLHNLYLRRTLERYPITPRRILDAGCGAGDHSFYFARRFPHSRVLAVDVQEHLIERNRRVASQLGLANVEFRVSDITALNLDERFDLITSIDVLEHIVNQRRAVEVLANHLTPGGISFFHVPTTRPVAVPLSGFLSEFHQWAESEHVAEEVTAEAFVASSREAGLTIIESRPTFGYWTGELATSLFALPYRNSPLNRLFQVLLILPCRGLIHLDPFVRNGAHFAVAVVGRRRD